MEPYYLIANTSNEYDVLPEHTFESPQVIKQFQREPTLQRRDMLLHPRLDLKDIHSAYAITLIDRATSIQS